MNATGLLSRLTVRGIMLRAVDDRIQAKPISALLPEEQEQLQRYKAELLTLLRTDVLRDELLSSGERQRLMTQTVDRLRRQYRGDAIDWAEADKINAKIGMAFTGNVLKSLLAEYEAAISAQLQFGHRDHD